MLLAHYTTAGPLRGLLRLFFDDTVRLVLVQQFYGGGVFQGLFGFCGPAINHGVLVVGFNAEEEYYIIKVSTQAVATVNDTARRTTRGLACY